MTTSDEDFVAFVRERGTSLLRLATLLAGNRHAGEDLFQTAVERTYARWSRAGGIQDLDAYIRQVIVRGARRQWRRRLRQPEILVATLPETASQGGGQLDVVARAALQQALALLTRQQRAVIVLRYVADQSEAQIASLLGCSVGTVKAHASRGLERLRAHPMAISALDTGGEY